VTPRDAAQAWGLGGKSSASLQTISALLGYGLIETAGHGGARRLRTSDLARRLLAANSRLTADEEQQALAEAALKPKLIAQYAERWPDGRPSDTASIEDLKLRHKFTDQAAVRFLQVFDEAMWFVRGGASVVGTYNNPERGGTRSPLAGVSAPRIIKGDYVQWRAGGVDQFPTPRKVVWISDGGLYLSIEGSRTRLAASEVRLVPPPPALPLPPSQAQFGNGNTVPQNANEPKIVQRGSRVEISAVVDLAGLQALQLVLPHYRAILTLSSPIPDDPPELKLDGAEISATPQDAADGKEEYRPAPFPVMGLQWALQHAHWLFDHAANKPVSIAEAAKVWSQFGLKPQSREFFDTIDGLLEFGLIEQRGSGDTRTIRISDLGWPIFRRPDPETAFQAVCAVARQPKLLRDYAARWGAHRPERADCIVQLVQEQGFTEEMAAQFVRCFDEIAVLINQAEPQLGAGELTEPSASMTPSQSQNQLEVVQHGGRVKIAADLDVTGLDALGETLICYEKILRLWTLSE
jgi:hypothetical protein